MRKDTCKHFNGVQNSRCEAEVNYRELAGPPETGYVRRLPCFVDSPLDHGEPKAMCPHFCLPSAEDLAEWDAFVNASIERHLKCTPLIVALKKEYKGRSGRVVRECPVCGGNLHMSISGYNGHVHGKCETVGCVEWME